MNNAGFTGAIVALAVFAGVSGVSFAQTSEPASPEERRAEVQNLPPLLQQLELEELRHRPDRRGGEKITGVLADDTQIIARIDKDGELAGMAAPEAALPEEVVAELLPQALRDSQVIGQYEKISFIGTRRNVIAIRGVDANGESLFSVFSPDGKLMRFGRGDGRPPHRMQRHKDGHGGRHMEMMRGKGKGHMDMPKPPEPSAQARPDDESRAMTPPFDPAEVNKRLTEAGYSGFGFLMANGRQLLLDAVNPQGEAVTLELDPEGEVLRETAR